MIVVVWGVSGCGKSTIGQQLAERMHWAFYDADDFHPLENIEKMRAGKPLTDEDRWPWLDLLATNLRRELASGSSCVLACSALKQVYRDKLKVDSERVVFVHLEGSIELIAGRLETRQHAFMNNQLLESQFATLEPSIEGITLDIAQSPDEICDAIAQRMALT